MSFLKEFKTFALRGNVMDMAVGVIIGAAFGKISSSLVSDIIMPPLSLLIGEVDFSNQFISLNGQKYATLAAAKEAGAPIIAYGNFINCVFDFLIIAFVVFLLVKQVNKLKPAEPPAAEAHLCPFCRTEIAEDATRCPHCTSELK